MLKNLAILILILMCAPLADAKKKHGGGGGGYGNPKEMVSKYLADDFRGSRVIDDPKAATKTLVNWDSEPPNDRWIVVQSYNIGGTKVRRRTARVAVKFYNLGELKGDLYFPNKTTEEVSFEIPRVRGPAKIDRPILMPHVSSTFAQDWMTKRLASVAPESEEAKNLQASLETLRGQLGPTSAKQKK